MLSLSVPAAPRPLPLALFLALALLPPALAAYVLWVAPLGGLMADRTALAARDFTVFWTAGRLAATSAWSTLADPLALTAALRDLFGPGMPAQIWPYPPTALLLATPLAALPFSLALAAYTIGTASALPAALRLGGGAGLAILLSPAVAESALAGQNGALTACLLVGGLLRLDRQPYMAGLLLGGLALKPQIGLLVPVCLVAGARWRTLATAASAALALIAASALLFGLDPWIDYLTRTQAVVAAYVGAPWHDGAEQRIFASAFMAARALGADLGLAWTIQGAMAIGCAICAFRLWRVRDADAARRIAATTALCLLACPWVHSYDMPALAASIILVWPQTTSSLRPALAWAWLWPGLMTLLPIPNPISTLTIASVAWVALRLPTLPPRPGPGCA